MGERVQAILENPLQMPTKMRGQKIMKGKLKAEQKGSKVTIEIEAEDEDMADKIMDFI
jgi:tRNA threonylcarbamoyladenosine modification (KEOPS) complex  Pcc1 subunit